MNYGQIICRLRTASAREAPLGGRTVLRRYDGRWGCVLCKERWYERHRRKQRMQKCLRAHVEERQQQQTMHAERNFRTLTLRRQALLANDSMTLPQHAMLSRFDRGAVEVWNKLSRVFSTRGILRARCFRRRRWEHDDCSLSDIAAG